MSFKFEPIELNFSDVIDLFQQFDTRTDTFVDSISNPQGGECYWVFNDDPKKKDNWRTDGIGWRNNGTKRDRSGVIRKKYYSLVTPSGLDRGYRREVYSHDNIENLHLVHYIGNHELVQPFPHRNNKN